MRVRMPEEVPVSRYEEFRVKVGDRFPGKQNLRFLSSQMHFESDQNVRTDVSNSLIGIRLDSADGKLVIQAKSDGLSVSRLSPYESWDALLREVMSQWALFVEVFKPEAVVRLGARYINRILLDAHVPVDLDAILTAGPKIPEGLPQSLDQFLTRVVLPVQRHDAYLAISQTLEASSPAQGIAQAAVLLDIDAFTDASMDAHSPAIWERLAHLREVKNMAFFGSLTKPAWEKFL